MYLVCSLWKSSVFVVNVTPGSALLMQLCNVSASKSEYAIGFTRIFVRSIELENKHTTIFLKVLLPKINKTPK